jgi:hypothetical protein
MTVVKTLSIFVTREKVWNKEKSTTQALERAMGKAFWSQAKSSLYIFGSRFSQLLTLLSALLEHRERCQVVYLVLMLGVL